MPIGKKNPRNISLRVRHLLQEQSRAYFLTLPKIWVKAMGLRQGSPMILVFNGPELRVFPEDQDVENEGTQ